MTYDLNTQLSATSPCIFEKNQSQLKQLRPQQSEFDSQLESYKLSSGMLIFNLIFCFLRIVTIVMFIDIIFKSKKYKSIYNSEAKKIIVIINLIFAYLQIVITIYMLYKLQKFYSQLKKYHNIIFIFLIFFVVYIISVFHLTHVLVNFDEYKYENICFLTHYFNFSQIITLIWLFIWLFYLPQLQKLQK
jgi:hypothetical protein